MFQEVLSCVQLQANFGKAEKINGGVENQVPRIPGSNLRLNVGEEKIYIEGALLICLHPVNHFHTFGTNDKTRKTGNENQRNVDSEGEDRNRSEIWKLLENQQIEG